MKVLSYDEKRQTLCVQYNTKTVWEYIGVSQLAYDQMSLTKSERVFKHILRNSNIVGISKGVIQ